MKAGVLSISYILVPGNFMLTSLSFSTLSRALRCCSSSASVAAAAFRSGYTLRLIIGGNGGLSSCRGAGAGGGGVFFSFFFSKKKIRDSVSPLLREAVGPLWAGTLALGVF